MGRKKPRKQPYSQKQKYRYETLPEQIVLSIEPHKYGLTKKKFKSFESTVTSDQAQAVAIEIFGGTYYCVGEHNQ